MKRKQPLNVTYAGIAWPVSLSEIKNPFFRKYLEEDEYGVYIKEGVRLPLIYRRKYKWLKFYRDEQIYEKYTGLRVSVKVGRKLRYLDNRVEIPTGSNKIEMKKLLRKGIL